MRYTRNQADRGFISTPSLPSRLTRACHWRRYTARDLVSGFTIIETIIVVTIFTIVMMTIISSVLYFYRTNANALEQAFAIESARRGIEFMVRDIREVAFADDGAYPIVSIGSTTMLFYSDIDRDDSVERVRFELDGTVLRRGLTNATGDPAAYLDQDEEFSVVSDNVRNLEEGVPAFTYFDEGGVEVIDYSNITDVVFVTVNLIVNINPTRLPFEFTLRSSASMRNLKEAL